MSFLIIYYIYIYNNNYINNIIYLLSSLFLLYNERQNPVSACCCVSCFEVTHSALFRVSEISRRGKLHFYKNLVFQQQPFQ